LVYSGLDFQAKLVQMVNHLICVLDLLNYASPADSVPLLIAWVS